MRTVGRWDILQLRYQEAISCLHRSFFHASVLVACSGIELLLKTLYDDLLEHIDDGNPLPREAAKKKDEMVTERGPVSRWTMGDWIRLYETCKLINELRGRFAYRFMRFNQRRLVHANDIWVKCKHDFKQAEEKDASKVCRYFKDFLYECRFPDNLEAPARVLTVDELGIKWMDDWRSEIARWLNDHDASVAVPLISQLTNLLELVLNLIGDDTVQAQYRTQLMVAANYVISTVDLMPEDKFEVHGLVDDSAVLVLALSWLLRQSGFTAEKLGAHWQGQGDIVDLLDELEQYILDNHSKLFARSHRQFGGILVWSTIRRVAKVGPEALWQNYWKEAY